jgi:hypothetical protein
VVALRPCGVLAHECLPLLLAPAMQVCVSGCLRVYWCAGVLVCSWAGPTSSEEGVRGTAGMCGGAARWSRAMRDRVGQR